jgi:hypothetical protein
MRRKTQHCWNNQKTNYKLLQTNRGSPLLHQQVQQQQSPVDSLERSLPSVAYHFHRRVVVNQQQTTGQSQLQQPELGRQ